MAFRKKFCKLQLEILRTTFADYDSFVHTFAHNAHLGIEGADESLGVVEPHVESQADMAGLGDSINRGGCLIVEPTRLTVVLDAG